MKSTRLERLGIDIPLSDRSHYHDDGVVDSLQGHLKELDRQYDPEGVQPSKEITVNDVDRGLCLTLEGEDTKSPPRIGEIHHHIFVVKDTNEQNVVFFQGHEETELILRTDNLPTLKSLLHINGLATDNLEGLYGEALCDIGGCPCIVQSLWKSTLFIF